jgi:hypothetical protein
MTRAGGNVLGAASVREVHGKRECPLQSASKASSRGFHLPRCGCRKPVRTILAG